MAPHASLSSTKYGYYHVIFFTVRNDEIICLQCFQNVALTVSRALANYRKSQKTHLYVLSPTCGRHHTVICVESEITITLLLTHGMKSEFAVCVTERLVILTRMTTKIFLILFPLNSKSRNCCYCILTWTGLCMNQKVLESGLQSAVIAIRVKRCVFHLNK